MTPLIAFTVPGLRVKNGENTREHWGTKHERKKKTYRVVGVAWLVAKGRAALAPPPYLVVLTRVGPAKMDPDGNGTALKHVQDEVARRLGVDDGDEAKVSWRYAQEKGPYAVRVEVYQRADAVDDPNPVVHLCSSRCLDAYLRPTAALLKREAARWRVLTALVPSYVAPPKRRKPK